MGLSVLYQDEWLLALDKPAGVLVHGDGTGAPSLTDAVRALTGDDQAQPVQRLDRETTGVLLFSLDKAVQPVLDAAVASGAVAKRYVALVAGAFPAGTAVVDCPLGRDRHDARRMRVSAGGRPALTRVTLLERRGRRSLVLAELGSGRRHQIRVHLASLGHPVVGDVLYGGPACRAGLCLHAREERLVHPVTGEALDILAPWPARLGAEVALPEPEGPVPRPGA